MCEMEGTRRLGQNPNTFYSKKSSFMRNAKEITTIVLFLVEKNRGTHGVTNCGSKHENASIARE
jgi:hypothetical protein